MISLTGTNYSIRLHEPCMSDKIRAITVKLGKSSFKIELGSTTGEKAIHFQRISSSFPKVKERLFSEWF